MPRINENQLLELLKARGLSQIALVERSGVSRAQIGRIVRGNVAEIRQKTIDDLAKGLGVDPAILELDGQVNRYLQWVRKSHSFVDFRGMGLTQLKKEPIDEIFVEPEAGLLTTQEQLECDESESASNWKSMTRTPNSASSIVNSRDRIVVIGNPGDGKTTFLRKLCFDRAQQSSEPDGIPVFLRLPVASRAFQIEPDTDLLDVLVATVPEESRQFVRERIVEKSDCVLVFDGLDEVGSEEERNNLVRKIIAFTRRYPGNRFVLSSRVVGFDNKPWADEGFTIVGLLDFRQKQIDEFVDRWTKVLQRIFDREESEVRRSLESAIFSNPQVRALAGNPLILTILAVLNESRGGGLPKRRVDLYSKIVDVFLDSWERTKRLDSFDETADVDLDSREFEWLLADLGLKMQRDDRTLAPKWWLREQITSFLMTRLGVGEQEAKDAGERILRYLSERTGLIEERGLKEFGFSHRTLQEYFAALGMINETELLASIPDAMRPYLFDPQWSEVIRLVAAKVPPLVAQSLLQIILDDPDPIGRFIRRGPILALNCLSDGVRIPKRDLVERLFDDCVLLGESRWLGVTINIINVLNEFKETRLDELAQKTKQRILEVAENCLDREEVQQLRHETDFESVLNEFEELKSLPSETAIFAKTKFGLATVLLINHDFQLRNPAKWLKQVEELLFESEQETDIKVTIIRHIGMHATNRQQHQRLLRKIISNEKSVALRSAAVLALAELHQQNNSKLIQKLIFSETEPVEVRSAGIRALEDEQAFDARLREATLGLLLGDADVRLRASAARAIGHVEDDPDIPRHLLRIVDDKSTPESLRAACLWGLENHCDDSEIAKAFEQWLESFGSEKLRSVISQIYVVAVADSRIPWNSGKLKTAQDILMSLKTPCPHAWYSLRSLATSRFLRQTLLIETVIERAIDDLSERIQYAFLFGSTARNEQDVTSDIDLFILGEVSIKELSSRLRVAEDTLGRPINPVIYSRPSFVEKFQNGDPFLADVVQREKIVVAPNNKSSTEIKDELGTMAAERVASTE